MITFIRKINYYIWCTGLISFLILTGCDSSSGGGGSVVAESCTGEGGAVYVKTGGSDSNPGTPDEPKLTIQSGIDCADALFDTGEVRVAQGTYTVDGTVTSLFQESMGINMKDGISLYGGYSSSDWSLRDPDVYVTTIRDTSSGDSGFAEHPGRAINCRNMSTTVIVDGFTVEGGSGEYNSAIAVEDASPHIRNCILTGGRSDGDGGSMNYGVHVYTGVPDIYNNTISGGSGAVYTYGIRSSGSESWIYDNVINGGSGSTASYGVSDYYADSIIERNFINSGSSPGSRDGLKLIGAESQIYNNVITTSSSEPSKSTGISIDTTQGFEPAAKIVNNTIYVGCASLSIIGISITTAHPEIINNIIFAAECDITSEYGIRELDSDADPSSVDNNDIYNFDGMGLYKDNGYINPLTTIVSGNFTYDSYVLATPTGHNNISVDPELDMTDLSPTGSSPASISTGGQDYSATFTDDFNGDTRTGSWSIGAYEF